MTPADSTEETALALSLLDALRALVRRHRAQNPGGTHWSGCETQHVWCALDAALDEITWRRMTEEPRDRGTDGKLDTGVPETMTYEERRAQEGP